MTSYEEKKKQFDSMITLYGRKTALEILDDATTSVFRLHVAHSNADSEIMARILELAISRGIEVIEHSRQELSRISKNARQDQGVAIDIQSGRYRSVTEIEGNGIELIGLDRVTNPQNLGLIIRTVAASPMHGLLLPKKGCAKIDPLVHKASAGTLLKSRIFHCQDINGGIKALRRKGFEILGLTGEGTNSLVEMDPPNNQNRLFILGNETDGLSLEVSEKCDRLIRIPLNDGVESLNVAAAASLVAFRGLFQQ